MSGDDIVFHMDDGTGSIPSGATKLQYFADNQRHLVCYPYSTDNLHQMARNLNISKHWFHKNHYDIPKRRIEEIQSYCTIVSPKIIVKIIKQVYFD